MPHERMKMKET